MRLITIEQKNGSKRIINTEQICTIYKNINDEIVISLAADDVITKFTDLEHAADYVRRASTHTFTPGR